MEPSAQYLSDPVFYDVLEGGVEAAWDRPTPPGWVRAERGDWLGYSPDGAALPAQGWKVHVSACPENADTVLDAVSTSCFERAIPFKFLRQRQLLLWRNEKAADRSASGKFVTIYPGDDAELEAVLEELGARLRGEPGPYILSDLRWGDGPLFVRYGGFVERWCLDPSGEPQLAVEDGDGRLVPDPRGPSFIVPAWVTLPAFLAPHLEARGRATTGGLPYRIEEALHFSNGGGVYAAVDVRTGEAVVLKEARPHAGLSGPGVDAVARLEREGAILAELAGLDAVPSHRGSFALGEHHFLVQERVDGTDLTAMFTERYPLMLDDPPATAIAEHAVWVLGVMAALEGAVQAVHDRGVVMGDLNPSNVIVRPDGGVALVDWEVAAPADAPGRPGLGTPGFAAPTGVEGFDLDRYALACLRLHLFLPLTRLFPLDAGKVDEVATAIAKRFPVPAEYLTDAVRAVRTASTESTDGSTAAAAPVAIDAAHWTGARDSMVRAILASATPDRDDRLFPGAIAQFVGIGGLDVAHGAAGVLYALDAAGAGRFPEHEDWLIERALRAPAGAPLGFYTGRHGIAHVLERLGRSDEAHRLLERCIDELDAARPLLGLDLRSGLAGIALNVAQFADWWGDAQLIDLDGALVEEVATRVRDERGIADVSGGGHPHAGLMRGSSGPALVALRAFERTGDAGLLDVAAIALRQDLRRCLVTKGGALHVDEGWRTMPYLADGSAGIGIVLAEYLRHRDDEELRDAQAAIRPALAPQFCIGSGLFAGRAGLLLALGHGAGRLPATDDPAVAAQLPLLELHALPYCGHLAFPGDGLLRLSMDLATGTAGVLLAVASVGQPRPAGLPFLAAESSLPSA